MGVVREWLADAGYATVATGASSRTDEGLLHRLRRLLLRAPARQKALTSFKHHQGMSPVTTSGGGTPNGYFACCTPAAIFLVRSRPAAPMSPDWTL